MFCAFKYKSLHDAWNPFSSYDMEAVLAKATVTVSLGYYVSGLHAGHLVGPNAFASPTIIALLDVYSAVYRTDGLVNFEIIACISFDDGGFGVRGAPGENDQSGTVLGTLVPLQSPKK